MLQKQRLLFSDHLINGGETHGVYLHLEVAELHAETLAYTPGAAFVSIPQNAKCIATQQTMNRLRCALQSRNLGSRCD
jgi:hypothetical protein